jgi:hypothetical protein
MQKSEDEWMVLRDHQRKWKKNTNNMVRRMKNQRWPENNKEEEKEDEQNKRGYNSCNKI